MYIFIFKTKATEEAYNISREAIYMDNLKHKNVIRCYNSFVYDNKVYTVMELAKGGMLSTYINDNGYLKEEESMRIFKQIHEAVKYIHSKNVIHRDIKPENILFKDKSYENVLVRKINKIVNRFWNLWSMFWKYKRKCKNGHDEISPSRGN
jgi:serine/threonine protein kinase